MDMLRCHDVAVFRNSVSLRYGLKKLVIPAIHAMMAANW